MRTALTCLLLTLTATLAGGTPSLLPGDDHHPHHHHEVTLELLGTAQEDSVQKKGGDLAVKSSSYTGVPDSAIPASEPHPPAQDSAGVPSSDYAGIPDSITDLSTSLKSAGLGQTGVDFGAGIEVTDQRPDQTGHHNPFVPVYQPPPELSQAWELTGGRPTSKPAFTQRPAATQRPFTQRLPGTQRPFTTKEPFTQRPFTTKRPLSQRPFTTKRPFNHRPFTTKRPFNHRPFTQPPAQRPSNPFLEGAINPPASSSFQKPANRPRPQPVQQASRPSFGNNPFFGQQAGGSGGGSSSGRPVASRPAGAYPSGGGGGSFTGSTSGTGGGSFTGGTGGIGGGSFTGSTGGTEGGSFTGNTGGTGGSSFTGSTGGTGGGSSTGGTGGTGGGSFTGSTGGTGGGSSTGGTGGTGGGSFTGSTGGTGGGSSTGGTGGGSFVTGGGSSSGVSGGGGGTSSGSAGAVGAHVVLRCPGPPSALPCVETSACDPYSGYLVTDNYQLGYPITPDTPTVAMVHCRLSGGSQVGVCCRKFPKLRPQSLTNTNTGGDTRPGWDGQEQPEAAEQDQEVSRESSY